MKKIFLVLLTACIALTSISQITSYDTSTAFNQVPPGSLNPGSSSVSAGTYELVLGSQPSNAWSAPYRIPFDYYFFGAPVTHFKVSNNGVLTFDTTATALPGQNENLPSTQLPDLSICAFWDTAANGPTGGNDRVRIDTFGTAPNRQLIIYWWSYTVGNPSPAYLYFSISINEANSDITISDERTSSPSDQTKTVGLQFNQSLAVQYLTDTISLRATNSLALSNINSYLFNSKCKHLEDFENVTTPNLPASWATFTSNLGDGWRTDNLGTPSQKYRSFG